MGNQNITAIKLKKLLSRNRHNLTSEEIELMESMILEYQKLDTKSCISGEDLLILARIAELALRLFGLKE